MATRLLLVQLTMLGGVLESSQPDALTGEIALQLLPMARQAHKITLPAVRLDIHQTIPHLKPQR